MDGKGVHEPRSGRKTYFVSGVCCSTEEAILRKTLNDLVDPGHYSFNSATCELSIPRTIDDTLLLRRLRDAGLGARSTQDLSREEPFWTRHAHLIVTATAAALALAGILLERYADTPVLPHALLLASIVAGGWKPFRKAYAAIRTLTLDMNVLMCIAVLGALLIGKWEEGAAVIVLYALSLSLESYSASRTRAAIRSLMRLSPDEANVLSGDREQRVRTREIEPGDIIIIRPGDRIPLDGTVVRGRSYADESPITGESVPVEKTLGDTVYAGSINEHGSLHVRVTHRSEETTIARIIHLVEEAQEKRAPVQHFVDTVARIYTPAVLACAILVALLPPLLLHEPAGTWLYRALVLLVIACPCALVISTPVTIVSALTTAARRGILIKGGKYLETLAKVKAIAFDKTGTLTEGRPAVTDIVPLNSFGRNDVLRFVAAIEQRSEHHLASAVLREAAREGLHTDEIGVDGFEAIPGLGVKASVGGETYYVGNQALSRERGYNSTLVERSLATFLKEGKTVAVLGRGTEALGIIAIQDTARLQSKEAIRRLKQRGIRHMMMLSGDNEVTVRRIATEVGIDDFAAGLLPVQKVKAVEDFTQRYGTVAMVGDGINDTPALAASSVGIAMGASGTDAALETADVVLMADDVGRLPALFGLSRRAIEIIRQNIALALSLKLLFLVLSVFGLATLWMAVLADDGAALAVILNGLRILSYKDEA